MFNNNCIGIGWFPFHARGMLQRSFSLASALLLSPFIQFSSWKKNGGEIKTAKEKKR